MSPRPPPANAIRGKPKQWPLPRPPAEGEADARGELKQTCKVTVAQRERAAANRALALQKESQGQHETGHRRAAQAQCE